MAADEKTTGLILRTRRLTETSLIVHWLTPDLGRIATVAKGALRPKSPFRGKLDLFFQGAFSFQRSRRSELHALREVAIENVRPNLRKDLERLQHSSYVTALLELTTENETPLPELFLLVEAYLNHLENQPASLQGGLAFELKFLRELGLTPDLSQARVSPGARQIMVKLLSLEWEDMERLKSSTLQLKEMFSFVDAFLGQHFGRRPRGREALGAAL